MNIAPLHRHFLGVERSVTGRAWRDRLDERGNARALAIVQRHGVPELLARIIAGREIEADAVGGYLDPTLKSLMPDPDVLTDMAAAATRIADAVERGETVAIFGDYDVDGATSTALLASFLRRGGLDPLLHIPDRIFEGLRAERRGDPRARRARRKASRHRRLRHHEPRAAGRSRAARPRHRRHRSPPGRRGAAQGGDRQSEPARRSLRARPSRRRRPGVPDDRRGQPRAAPPRLLERVAARARTCSTLSTSSRSAPSPTWCRSSASTAPSSPRG